MAFRMAEPAHDNGPVSVKEWLASTPTFRGCVEEPLIPIGVFWDIENCQVPKNKSAVSVATVIRTTFFRGHREAEFLCVCDINKESKEVIQELNDAQITVVHINATCKNAADDKLRQCMRRFAYTHGSPATLILISGDVNFAPELSDFRHWRKLTVIVIHNGLASEALLACAHQAYAFNTLVADLPSRSQTRPQTCKTSCELVVTNLPKTKEVGPVKNRLKRLSDNCGGRVICVSNCGEARLRFVNADTAARARKRMDGEDVFGNRISVNFPPSGSVPATGRDGSPHCINKKNQVAKTGSSPDWGHKAIRNGASPKVSSKSGLLPLQAVDGTETAQLFGQPWGHGYNTLPRNVEDSAIIIKPLMSLAMTDSWTENTVSAAGKAKLDEKPKQRFQDFAVGVARGRTGNGPNSTNGSALPLPHVGFGEQLIEGGNRSMASSLPEASWPSSEAGAFPVRRTSGQSRRNSGGSAALGSLRPGSSYNRRNASSPQPFYSSKSSSSSASSSPHHGASFLSSRSSGQFFDSNGDPDTTEPVELLITNLDQCKDISEMKQYLMSLFQEHVMVLHVSVSLCPDGSLTASVRVQSMQDAQYAISQLHRRRIGSKRILISLANANNSLPLNVLRPDVAALLLDVPDHKLPLFKFRELFEKRYHRSIGVSELHRLRDMVTIQENPNGRIVALHSDYRSTPSPACSDGSKEVQDILETAHCDIHCPNHYEGKGWAEKEQALQLPNVVISLKVLAPRVHKLLQVHTNSIPLNSLPTCYECEFNKLEVVEEGGVPLEHLVTCIPGVHIIRGPSRIKRLGWIDDKTTERPEFRTVSPPLANQLALFCREIVDLLKNHPYCRMSFAKFIPMYHHHFGRQCRVADYGYTKLVDLFDALTHVVQVIGEGNKRMLTLTHRAQIKRFTADLLRILKAQVNKQIVLSEFPEAYLKCVGKPFDVFNYGVCDVADILPEVAEGTIVIDLNGPDTVIAIPKREQTSEEADRTKEFAQEAMELLRHSPRYRMAFTKFIPAYHHHFGKQCRVADYGFTKLIELFEAIPQFVEVIPSEDDEDKMLLLARCEMVRVFSEQIDSMMRAPGRQIMTLDKFRSVFIQAHGYNLHPEDFGVSNVRELLEMIAHVVKVVDTASGPVVTAVGQGLSFCVRKILLNEPKGRMRLGDFIWAFKQRYGQKCDIVQIATTLKDYVKVEGTGATRTISLQPFHFLYSNIVTLLLEKSGRLPLTMFDEAYRERFGHPLQAAQYGYANLLSLLQAMHEILFIRGRSSKKSVVLNQEGACYLALFKQGGRPLTESHAKVAETVQPPQDTSMASVDLLSGPIPNRLPSPMLRPVPAALASAELMRFDSPSEDVSDTASDFQDESESDVSSRLSRDPLQLCNLMDSQPDLTGFCTIQPSPPPRVPRFPPPPLVPPLPEMWMQQCRTQYAVSNACSPTSSPIQTTPKTPLGASHDSSENEINTPPCIRELIAPSSAESTSSQFSGFRSRQRPRLAVQFPSALLPSSN